MQFLHQWDTKVAAIFRREQHCLRCGASMVTATDKKYCMDGDILFYYLMGECHQVNSEIEKVGKAMEELCIKLESIGREDVSNALQDEMKGMNMQLFPNGR